MENQKPEALELADKLKNAIQLLDMGFDEDIDPDELDKAALELEHLHARVQELEAMLEYIGAGGVSAQRITQADTWDEEREKLLRALYDRGYEDMAKERDYDPLGASEFDAAMCAPRAGAARAKQEDARDAERWGSEPVTGTPFLQEEDQHLLDRFIETTEDNEGFDIGKEAIKRLANLGVVESLGFGRYGVTMFGYWVHEHYWYQNPSLPLKTNLDRDADARAAIAAAKENKQ